MLFKGCFNIWLKSAILNNGIFLPCHEALAVWTVYAVPAENWFPSNSPPGCSQA